MVVLCWVEGDTTTRTMVKSCNEVNKMKHMTESFLGHGNNERDEEIKIQRLDSLFETEK